jgi:hypothetical protein
VNKYQLQQVHFQYGSLGGTSFSPCNMACKTKI